IVSLIAVGNQNRVPPSLCQQLFLPGRSWWWRKSGWRPEARRENETELHYHRHPPGRIGRRRERQLEVNADGWIGRIVGVPHEFLDDDRHLAVLFVGGTRDLPVHLRH